MGWPWSTFAGCPNPAPAASMRSGSFPAAAAPVRFLQADVTVSHRVFPILVLFELNGVGEFLVANFAFHGFALRMRVVRRPNLAAEAPQHENARDIASTGPQIVLSEGEFESATRRHHENAYRPDRRPDPCGAKEHRAFVRRDEGARRPESAARGPPRRWVLGRRRCRRHRRLDGVPPPPAAHMRAAAAGRPAGLG